MEAVYTEFDPETMSVGLRPFRGNRSVLKPSVGRADYFMGLTTVVDPEWKDPRDAGLAFAAHNNHDLRCGGPPRLWNTANLGLYHGYFEIRYGEQFVFTCDRARGAGTVSGDDLIWNEPKSFNLLSLDEVLCNTQRVAAQGAGLGCNEALGLPVMDAALALGRLTGLTGKDEIIWLRACLAACMAIGERLGGPASEVSAG